MMTIPSLISSNPRHIFGSGLAVVLALVVPHPVYADEFQKKFTAPIEEAHHAADWRSKDGVKVKFRSIMGGKVRFEGTMLTNPTASKSRLELKDGTVIVFDGQTCWMSPPDADLERARFHSLTWPYFLAAPMKLRDPGSQMEDLGKILLQDREYDAAKLTFDLGVGDTPGDWYVLYRNPDSGRLEAMAYIVTYFGKDAPSANEPHAVTYENFEQVDGIPIPMLWRFWNWSEQDGLNEQLGQFEISDVEFITPDAEMFKAPQGAEEQLLPEP